MANGIGWEYIGKCIYCETPMYKKDEVVRAGILNPHCSCRAKAICDKCEKDCTDELKTRHGKFMWGASGLCVGCQEKAIGARV